MNRAERRRAGKAGAITPGVVWSFIIVRRERDLPNLLAALEAGDPIAQQFFTGLPQWLKLWRDAAVPPLCLTCEHAFAPEATPPDTFAMTYSEDPRTQHMMLTGICLRCALAKTDTELLELGSKLVCKAIDGRSIGFSNTCPAPGVH